MQDAARKGLPLNFLNPSKEPFWGKDGTLNISNMFCKNCGNKLGEHAAVCTKCGVPTGQGLHYCPHCGAEHDPLAVVCVKCGCALNNRTAGAAGSDMSFGDAIKTCYGKYATFSGRASRSEYWFWFLYNLALGFVLLLIPLLGWIFLLLLILGHLLPNLAVLVRRLHDTGRSGLWALLGLIPFLGAIALLVMCIMDSDKDNEYGQAGK